MHTFQIVAGEVKIHVLSGTAEFPVRLLTQQFLTQNQNVSAIQHLCGATSPPAREKRTSYSIVSKMRMRNNKPSLGIIFFRGEKHVAAVCCSIHGRIRL